MFVGTLVQGWTKNPCLAAGLILMHLAMNEYRLNKSTPQNPRGRFGDMICKGNLKNDPGGISGGLEGAIWGLRG